MENNVKNDNSIFLYAVTGVLLFISSMAFVLGYKSDIDMSELSYTAMAFVLFGSSMSLLYKAIKEDTHRLKQI